jgi:hypothetical protein
MIAKGAKQICRVHNDFAHPIAQAAFHTLEKRPFMAGRMGSALFTETRGQKEA